MRKISPFERPMRSAIARVESGVERGGEQLDDVEPLLQRRGGIAAGGGASFPASHGVSPAPFHQRSLTVQAKRPYSQPLRSGEPA